MLWLLLLLGYISLSSGCASLTRGTTEAFVVETKPPGADVNSSSGWRCTTPCSINVKRRSDFVLTISRANYETVTATVTSSIDGAGAAGMAGNVILGGLIGAGIDVGTGAMHSHKPNPLVVEMVPLTSNAQLPATTRPGGRSTTTATKTSMVPAKVTTSSDPRASEDKKVNPPAGRVYLDDYELVTQPARARQRKPVVLGQKEKSD